MTGAAVAITDDWPAALLLGAFAHATLLVAGVVAVRWLDGRRRRDAGGILARALILGPAVVTLQELAGSLIGLPPDLWWVGAPWWAAAAWSAWSARRGRVVARDAAERVRGTGCHVAACALLVVPCAVAALAGAAAPIHTGDAMHNFALPARVFAAYGCFDVEALRGLADPGNVRYPPLLACCEALFLRADPMRGAWTVQPLHACALLAWLLLALEALGGRRLGVRGLAAFAIIAAVPQPMHNAIHGFADLRLAATTLLLLLEIAAFWRSGDARLLVATALAAAWTKEEGVLLALLAAACLVRRGVGPRADRGRVLAVAAGIAAAALAWPVWAIAHDLPLEYAGETRRLAAANVLAAGAQVPAVLTALAAASLRPDAFGTWPHGWIWPFAAAAWLCTARQRPARWLAIAGALHAAALAAGIALAGVPQVPFASVLDATADRVLLQLLPWPVLLLAAIAAPPVVGTTLAVRPPHPGLAPGGGATAQSAP